MKKFGGLVPMLTAVVLLLGQASCEKLDRDSTAETPGREALPPNYPIDRLITNAQGVVLDVQITGRTEETVTFVRKDDAQSFDYPIHQLSDNDRQYVLSLPVKAAPAAQQEEPSPPVADVRLRNLQRKLDEIDEEVKSLQQQAQQLDGASIKHRSLQSRIRKLNQDRARVEAAMQ